MKIRAFGALLCGAAFVFITTTGALAQANRINYTVTATGKTATGKKDPHRGIITQGGVRAVPKGGAQIIRNTSGGGTSSTRDRMGGGGGGKGAVNARVQYGGFGGGGFRSR
jgi:hypothetical protein